MTPEFKYGLLGGVGISLWMMAEYALGLHTMHLDVGAYTGYFSLVIPWISLFLLLKRKQSEGHLELGSGIVSGLTASLLGAMVVYGFNLAYNQWINPEWVDNALAVKVATMRAHDISEVEIRRAITAFRHANSATGLITHVIVSLTIIGGIFSAALTLVLQARAPSRNVS